MMRQSVACATLMIAIVQAASAQRPAASRDLLRVREVSDPQLSSDGAWVAYTVTSADTLRDRQDKDIWMTSWDGTRSVRVTSSPDQEHAPRWSPDGRFLAFLSSRQDPHDAEQLWLLDRAGGEAERVTNLPGGISEYAWAPDGHRVALIVSEPPADSLPIPGDSTQHWPKPIVVDRFAFKYDGEGFLGAERDHLYLFDLATRRAELVTPGPYDESSPSWSPDGSRIAFVSRRRPEFDRTDNWDIYVVEAKPGAQPRQVTTFEGADLDPEWGSRPPSWSPDGKLLAYVQGGRPELIYYGVQKVAVVPTDGGPARVLTGAIDRNVLSPSFSPGGKSVVFLLEGDRVYHLARVPVDGGEVEELVSGSRAVTDLSLGRDGRIAVVASTTAQPDEVYAVEKGDLRRLSRQNDAWLASVHLAPVEEISVRSKDGTEIHGFMVKPPDFQPGRRYPTILRIHGGPVWQFYHDFANLDWQVLAAAGDVGLGVKPRGSSGRGGEVATAIWAGGGEKGGGGAPGPGARGEVRDCDLGGVGSEGRRGRARRGGLGGAAGHRRSRPARRRRLELRRDPDRRGHRAGQPVQGRHQRRGAGQCPRRLRDRHVRDRVRGGAGQALGEPRGLDPGVVSLPARRSNRDARTFPLRRPGLERPAP